ncbi:MAG: hypothetical protein LC732_05930 [Acidobacteria bacterium]|nr:hypothetical protein [Acidobacteriota bacterium]
MKILLLVLLLLPATLLAAPDAYRLDLELNPAAPFPFLSKFGTVEISVHPGGVSGKALVLRGFSRNGSSSVTVMNPLARLFVELPLETIRKRILSLSGSQEEVMPKLREFPVSGPLPGKVRGLDARRYRVHLGPESHLDVWTVVSIPPNPQYLRLARLFAGTISANAESLAAKFEGMPVYVEMNTTKYKKLPLLRVKQFTPADEGGADALKVGRVYAKAPGSDWLLE